MEIAFIEKHTEYRLKVNRARYYRFTRYCGFAHLFIQRKIHSFGGERERERTRRNWKIEQAYLGVPRRWWRRDPADFYCDDESDCGSPCELVGSIAPPSPRCSTRRRISLEG